MNNADAWEAARRPVVSRMATVLTEMQHEFIDWLLDPSTSKGSQTKWADDHGIAGNTLVNWKKHPTFKAEWTSRFEAVFGGVAKVQEVVDAMQRKAADGDSKAAGLFLGWVERLNPKRGEDKVDGDVSNWSDDQLAEARAAATARRAPKR